MENQKFKWFADCIAANQVVPGQTVDPSVHGGTAGLGQKALLAKKFAKAK